MGDLVIQARNISKLYRKGSIGAGSFRKELSKFWQQNILKKTGHQENINGLPTLSPGKDYFWALKNIEFDIKQGETWGIIGSNGAGKSTLLKIISKIIKPTEGTIKGNGKISSLLEVGTGFHPELTGRENIFISGHMLGMNRAEILKKFDEIVAFSGIESFIDTPVKRYSSGMYVRLAFSVAAHLEPDILIVDEVLAVGDLDFQKKCLGKMNEASAKKGRTVLFVSHNLQAVVNLCSKSMLLEKGCIRDIGDTKSVIRKYAGASQKKIWKKEFPSLESAPGNAMIKILSVELIPGLEDPFAPIDRRTNLTVKYRFYLSGLNSWISTDLLLFTHSGECIFDIQSKPVMFQENVIEATCKIPGSFLNEGAYFFSLYFVKENTEELFSYNECLSFEVVDFRENTAWHEKWWGYVRPDFPLTLSAVTSPAEFSF